MPSAAVTTRGECGGTCALHWKGQDEKEICRDDASRPLQELKRGITMFFSLSNRMYQKYVLHDEFIE
jgi:hypothetical protein